MTADRPPPLSRPDRTFADVLRAAAVHGPDWDVVISDEIWILATPSGIRLPSQGWKLHVSATILSAESVLARTLPVLVDVRPSFKVVASLDGLRALNEGHEGLSQIGKFMTVYPTDERHAVELASRLDRVTRDRNGPPIPSDRRFARGSIVYYRYGGFDGRTLQLPYGEVVPAIVAPDGALVHDRRDGTYRPPAWVQDPFQTAVAADVAEESRALVVADRFVLTALVHHTPRGKIFLALDLEGGRRAIVKQAFAAAAAGADGRDARDQLRNEYAVLTELCGDPRFPEPYELVEHDDSLSLAMEDVGGTTLGERVAFLRARGRRTAPEQIRLWGIEIAQAVGVLHARGLIHRDLKPTNVVIGADGRLRLIDLELAVRRGHEAASLGRGTPGYMSAGQAAGNVPCVADDVYGYGALMYFVATGGDPGQTPGADALADRPLRLLNPALPDSVAAIIERCLHPEPGRRFLTMETIVAAWSDPRRPTWDVGRLSVAAERLDAQAIARRAALSVAAGYDGIGPPRAWISRRHSAGASVTRDVNTGVAGVVLALADLMGIAGPRAVRATEDGARWLANTPGGTDIPGLYVGEAGVALALLRAGQLLQDSRFVDAALERGRALASAPYASPDLFNGTAGRLLTHLILWDATQSELQLAAARACGEALLESAERPGVGKVSWTIPEGYGGLSGRTHCGYSHGAAGIGDVLLDLHEATGEARYADAALDAARWLTGVAVPANDDDGGIEWPIAEGGDFAGPLWCHGSAGIARFFLHLARIELAPEAMTVARRAALAVMRGGRALGPTRCHGLAGSIELLLDFHAATGSTAYLEEAWTLARLLMAFAIEHDGTLAFASDTRTAVEPGYMLGSAGVALTLARLADPARPHQLSRRGFRWTGVSFRPS